MLLREMFQTKTAVTSFGRMNPPTSGHARLIETIKNISGDRFLFLSHSVDKNKNPLAFETKKNFVQTFFSDISVGHENVRTPIDMMKYLNEQGYKKVIFVAGSDRVEKFQKLFNDYNDKEYKFESITVINAGQRDPDSDDVDGMSASKLRSFVKENNFQDFKSGVPLEEYAHELFNELRKSYGYQ